MTVRPKVIGDSKLREMKLSKIMQPIITYALVVIPAQAGIPLTAST